MGYEDRIDGEVIRTEYDSLAEYANAAERRRVSDYASSSDSEWTGASWEDALELARHGWHEQLDATLGLAESAVLLAEKEHMMDTFNPLWDVTGAEVDIGAYLAGTPECMIDYPLSQTSKQGRVVTLIANVAVNSCVSVETIIKRGQFITALALALSRLGHETELWVSVASGRTMPEQQTRVKVKGTDDELDPAAIMFAYAHPAMLRQLAFAVISGLAGKWGADRRKSGMYGQPVKPSIKGLPDETIVLPELNSDRDVPDADEFLKQHLGELGLLAE